MRNRFQLMKLTEKIKAALASPRYALVFIGLGGFFRLERYLRNQALWLDEAWRALEVLRQSYSDILLGRNVCLQTK